MCGYGCTHMPGGLTRSHAACRLVVSLSMMVLAGVCAAAVAERPVAVDHSTEIHFPPIGQQMWGDCTCFSSCYYYSTYTQARDEGLDASGGDLSVVCSPAFVFSLIAEGAWGAVCTERAMEHLGNVGCATIAEHSYPTIPWTGDPTLWPTEVAWIGALRNRPGPLQKIRADNDAGLETIRQHIADGGCAVTRAYFHGNYWDYDYCGDTADPTGPGINNYVMYSTGGTGPLFPHSICICGYDDARTYVDDYGQPQRGAFLIANSEGQDWGWYNSTGEGTRGFIWVAYEMFKNPDMGMGWYVPPPEEWSDVDPCWGNPDYPEVYYHDDRPDYRPKLYGVAGINHSQRNMLTFSGGIGPTGAPEFTGPDAIAQTDEGAIPITHARRPVVDLTDGLGIFPYGATKNVFISLALKVSASTPATITSVDFYCDFDGDGVYTTVPGDMDSTVMVSPGTTGYVSVSLTRPIPADFDGDLDVDAADFAFFAICLSGSDVNAAPGCEPADLGGDGDVDLDDFMLLQGQFTGPLP